ncbi:zinc finger CCCH domain-containing protein, partial [archaeon]
MSGPMHTRVRAHVRVCGGVQFECAIQGCGRCFAHTSTRARHMMCAHKLPYALMKSVIEGVPRTRRAGGGVSKGGPGYDATRAQRSTAGRQAREAQADRVPCVYFNTGRCRAGDACTFAHVKVPPEQLAVLRERVTARRGRATGDCAHAVAGGSGSGSAASGTTSAATTPLALPACVGPEGGMHLETDTTGDDLSDA